MIVYFTDRNLEIKGHASTSLPGGLRISEDVLSEDIESGVNTFSFSIGLNDKDRLEMAKAVKVGNFVLRSGGRSFSERENTYNSLYQIIDTEYDTSSQEMTVYAEDAGLELINKVCPAVKLTNKSLSQMLSEFVAGDWTLNLIACPTNTKTYEWEGENTATERINSVAALFDCEVFYSFVVERLEITAKVINVTPRRGKQEATVQLRLNNDIDRICTKTSISQLATALSVSGGTLDGKDTPINLKGYSYSYTDPETGDVYQVDSATGQMRNITAMKRWKSQIDSDGLILKSFSFDTTDKSVLAGQARAELQKLCKELVEYEVDFVNLPEDAQLGDRVNIIDEDGELYLEARLLKIESSISAKTQKATIGDYIYRQGGISSVISDGMRTLLKEAVRARLEATTISIVSSGGNLFHNTPIDTTLIATVFYGDRVITEQTELEEVFGSGAQMRWFDALGTQVGSGFEYSVESNAMNEDFTVELHDGEEA